jgi:hypothetical protein
MIRKLINMLLIAAIGIAVAISEAHATRIESTNAVVSAPLNLVNRSFARLQSQFENSLLAERLTYRSPALGRNENSANRITELLINMNGGPIEAQLKDLLPVDPSLATSAIQAFINNESGARTERFSAATKAALARNDVHLFSARILERARDARVLVIVDEETHELLVLTLSRR